MLIHDLHEQKGGNLQVDVSIQVLGLHESARLGSAPAMMFQTIVSRVKDYGVKIVFIQSQT